MEIHGNPLRIEIKLMRRELEMKSQTNREKRKSRTNRFPIYRWEINGKAISKYSFNTSMDGQGIAYLKMGDSKKDKSKWAIISIANQCFESRGCQVGNAPIFNPHVVYWGLLVEHGTSWETWPWTQHLRQDTSPPGHSSIMRAHRS